MISFSVSNWAAWSKKLKTKEDWLCWSENLDYQSDESLDFQYLKAVPPMLRRRLGIYGKMAIEVALNCLGEIRDIPIVFCSRHGEVWRSVEILEALTENQTVSPTTFSLSVHNAVLGILSIILKNQANGIAISARKNLVEAGIIEVAGLLNDGAEKVLLIVVNNDLPQCFQEFKDREELDFAFAWLIEKNGEKQIQLNLQDDNKKTDLPEELAVLRFFLAKDKMLQNRGWQWSKNV